MTVSDYIQAVRLWRIHGFTSDDVTAQTIRDVISNGSLARQVGYQPIDAEDSVIQMCMLMLRSGNYY